LAVSSYKIETKKEIDLKYLVLAGISVAIRPTSIISYIPFYLYHVIYTASDWSTRAHLIGRTIQMVIYILLCVLGFDFIWYRSNAVTFINFLKVNIIDGIASEYGIHRLGWYITQGLPVTCGICYPLGLYGLYKCFKIHKIAKIMAASLFLNLFFLELGPHKEFRFIQNAIPVLTLFASKSINSIFGKRHYQTAVNWICTFNLFVAFYFSFVHQKGPIELSRIWRREYCDRIRPDQTTNEKLVFLGVCHALPGEYSRYCSNGRHLNVEQLECLPSLDQSEFLTRPINQSESGRTVKEFQKDSRRVLDDFIHSEFDEICLFDFDLSRDLENIFENHDWIRTRKIFHSHFSDQGKWIYCFSSNT